MLNYIFFTLIILILNRLAGFYANIRGEKLLKEPYQKLPDIIQDNIPQINMNIPDYVLCTCIIYSIFYSIFYRIFYNNNNLYICYETLLLSLAIRPIFVLVTTLPTCMPKPRINIEESFYNKFFNSTHDLMFSGHTLVFMFCGKIIGGYIGFIFQYIYPILLIVSRQHYTIDVLVSFVVYNALYYQHSNIVYISNIYLS